MRARTLRPVWAEIAMLDAVATRAATKAPTITKGFDDDFKEVVVVTTNGARIVERKEQDSIFIPSQVEVDAFEALQMMTTGNSPNTTIRIVWAFRNLEEMGLIDPETGDCLVRVNDRLVSFCDDCRNRFAVVRTPPGLYVTQLQPTFGISNTRDLLIVTLEDREQFTHG